jgi:hypothetical protein
MVAMALPVLDVVSEAIVDDDVDVSNHCTVIDSFAAKPVRVRLIADPPVPLVGDIKTAGQTLKFAEALLPADPKPSMR